MPNCPRPGKGLPSKPRRNVTGAGLYDVLTLAPGDAPIERKFVVDVSESHISQSFGESMVSFTLDRRFDDGNGGNHYKHLGSAREFATSYPSEMAASVDWLNPMPKKSPYSSVTFQALPR